jgi:S-adenosylmethionine hydrolase
MSSAIVTLTTDFGEKSPYVAAMKGVLLSINPEVRLLDLSHQMPPQDVQHTAFFLAASIPYFPQEVLHVVVVDPGVGTERAVLYIETGGHRLLVPDNGCWTMLLRDDQPQPTVIRLTESRFWRHPMSATFHGRDIFAPVAGHLSRGLDYRELGSPAREWVQLARRPVRIENERVVGEVIFIDEFGNLISNIPAEALGRWETVPLNITVGSEPVPRLVRTYGEAEPGTLVALISSAGTLEVALNQGNAAQRTQARVGTCITVTRRSEATD